MSLMNALKSSPPASSTHSEMGTAVHLAGHAVALAAHEVHFTGLIKSSDLCGQSPAAACSRASALMSRHRAITIAAGRAAEYHWHRRQEVREETSFRWADLNQATRIDLDRAKANGDVELILAEEFACADSTDWDDTAGYVVELIGLNWGLIDQVAERFSFARTLGLAMDWESIAEFMEDLCV